MHAAHGTLQYPIGRRYCKISATRRLRSCVCPCCPDPYPFRRIIFIQIAVPLVIIFSGGNSPKEPSLRPPNPRSSPRLPPSAPSSTMIFPRFEDWVTDHVHRAKKFWPPQEDAPRFMIVEKYHEESVFTKTPSRVEKDGRSWSDERITHLSDHCVVELSPCPQHWGSKSLSRVSPAQCKPAEILCETEPVT